VVYAVAFLIRKDTILFSTVLAFFESFPLPSGTSLHRSKKAIAREFPRRLMLLANEYQ
jgi:hypothetical protein